MRVLAPALFLFVLFGAINVSAQETTNFTVKLEPYERMFMTPRTPGLVLGDVHLQPRIRYEERPSFGSALVNPGRFDDTEEAQLEAYLDDYPAWSFVVGRMKRQLKKDGTDDKYDPLGALVPKLNERRYVIGVKRKFTSLLELF
jgi:hypothetical protein